MDKRNLLVILVLLILVGVAGYMYWPFDFFSSAPEAVDLSALDPGEQSSLEEYRKIKNISLDFELLNDPFFKSLRDVSLPPSSTEPLGRSNPFLPF